MILTGYRSVVHVRQIDRFPTFNGVGKDPYEVDVNLATIESIDPCKVTEFLGPGKGHRDVELENFFTLFLTSGKEIHIDETTRDELRARMNP
ncbi:hypothetical protein [Microvirga mediterraneensis]|uniref:Uncharacterized protein n=1 Tax=Microvirga mediterraneensis TaxID=2754695 RepID=A0A838BWH4_9HYPH|nr:hypothetical protein [Microvirga mediterraneensis]MBA1159429.1 hypothetical protein [Microvirga mediterraneensis]